MIASCCFRSATNLYPSLGSEGSKQSQVFKDNQRSRLALTMGQQMGRHEKGQNMTVNYFHLFNIFFSLPPPPPLSLFLSLPHLVLKNTLSFTHGHLISHSFSYSLKHTLSFTLSLSLTHTHTHTQSSFKTVPHFNNLSEK